MANNDQPTDVDVITTGILSVLDRWQCSFPGLVTQAADVQGRVLVQPAIRIPARNGQQLTPKPVLIPVAWTGWGEYGIQGKLAVGDEVLVRCQDKNWLAWLEQGGQVDDTAIGGHQSGYAVAEPVQLSKPRRLPPLPPGAAVRIGRKDSLTTVLLGDDGTITLQGTEVFMSSGTGFAQFLKLLQDAINLWVPVPNDGGAALKTALAAWLLLTPPTGGAPPP